MAINNYKVMPRNSSGLSDRVINLIERYLRGVITSVDRRYNPISAMNFMNENTVSDIEVETVVTVELRSEEIEYFAHRIESIEADMVQYFMKNKELLEEKEIIDSLIETHPSCKKAWDNFIMVATLATDNPESLEKIRKITPL